VACPQTGDPPGHRIVFVIFRGDAAERFRLERGESRTATAYPLHGISFLSVDGSHNWLRKRRQHPVAIPLHAKKTVPYPSLDSGSDEMGPSSPIPAVHHS